MTYVLIMVAMLASGVVQQAVTFNTHDRCETARQHFLDWCAQREAILAYASCELQ